MLVTCSNVGVAPCVINQSGSLSADEEDLAEELEEEDSESRLLRLRKPKEI